MISTSRTKSWSPSLILYVRFTTFGPAGDRTTQDRRRQVGSETETASDGTAAGSNQSRQHGFPSGGRNHLTARFTVVATDLLAALPEAFRRANAALQADIL